MLCLNRKVGEAVVIDLGPPHGLCTVRVVQCGRGKVRLAFDCVRDVPIWRSELAGPPPLKRPES